MILVTGGTGYIRSHMVVALIENGHDVVILDNLFNSSEAVVDSIKKITGKAPTFVRGEIRDKSILQEIFKRFPIQTVFPFAGLKDVGEAEDNPALYYDNDVLGSIQLFQGDA